MENSSKRARLDDDQRRIKARDFGTFSALGGGKATRVTGMDLGEARLQLRGGEELATTIYEIGLLTTEDGDLDDVLEAILRRILYETGATWVGIELVDVERQELHPLCSIVDDGRKMLNDWRQPLSRGVVGRVVNTGEVQCFGDVTEVECYEEIYPGIRSEAAAPLIVGEQVVGVLNIESVRRHAFGPTVMALLKAVVTPVALTIRNAKLIDDQRRRAEHLAMLNRVSQIITSTTDLDELLQRTVRSIREQLDYEMVAIGLAEKGEVVLRAVDSRDGVAVSLGWKQPLGIGVTGEVVASGKSLLVPDVSDRANYTAAVPSVRAEMCCPLRVGDRIIGFLDSESSRAGSFDEHDLVALETVAEHISQAIENARRLQSLEEERQDLVAMVVHDLRNPLTIIQTALDLLSLQLDAASDKPKRTEGFPFKPLRRYLLSGQSAGQEMLVLINGLLDLQKMESGAFKIKHQKVPGGDVVRGVAHRCQVVADAHQISLEVDIDPEIRVLECDIDLFSRVLENLLSNALKYTPEGGQVRISASRAKRELILEKLGHPSESVLFTVEDTGPGIPREDRERVFEKFAVVELRRRAGKKFSTGLGLAFCRHAVKSHGGAIWVEGLPASGSRFCVLMPTMPQLEINDPT